MKLVDSSGWLEFFTGGPLAEAYGGHLADLSQVITPTIVLYEVYRKIKRERAEEEALIAAAQIQKTRLVPLDEMIALTAADIGIEHGLAMADAIIVATALTREAELITSNADFERLPGVTYLRKRRGSIELPD
jgi:predicted nucleic acid-binding protein